MLAYRARPAARARRAARRRRAAQADDLSRWVLAHPDQFDPTELRCWRIGSDTWLALAGEQLEAVDRVERPVGVFVVPALGASDGWQLTPVLSLDAIRLIVSLGGRLERDLRSAVAPDRQPRASCSSGSTCTRCTPGRRNALTRPDSSRRSSPASSQTPISPGVPRDKRDRWGRLAVRRRSYRAPDGTTTCRARAAGAHVPGARVHAAAARVGAAR